MSNANQDKGKRWERALRDYFRGRGIAAYRPAQEGRADVGDLHGLSPFVGQAKDWADLAGAVRAGTDGAVDQATRAGEPFGVNLVKRRRAGPDRAYAVMTGDTFVRVLLRLRAAESLLAVLDPDRYADHLTKHGA